MKILSYIMMLLLGVISFCTSFANGISQSELTTQINNGNILSDAYNTLENCTSIKDKYNLEFPSYKRSQCFLNNGSYYYFICQSNNSCVINTQSITTNSSTNVPHKAKLDAFLNKIIAMKKELNDDSKYEKLLTQVEGQLKTLGVKYKNNQIILQMLSYLSQGVQDIKTSGAGNSDLEDFFCELMGGCENTTKPNACPVMDAPLCKYGGPKLISTSVDAYGCEVQKYECPTEPASNACPVMDAPLCKYGWPKLISTSIDAYGCEVQKYECPTAPSCTREYSPVCAQPPMPTCSTGVSCTQVMPQIKTYSNTCLAEAEKASVLYTGECRTTTGSSSSTSSSSTSSGGGQTDSQKLVTSVFNQILKRNPEQAGLTYWVSQLDTGKVTQSNLSIVIACAALASNSDKINAQTWLTQNNISCGTTSSASSSSSSSSSTSSGGGATSSSSSSSGGPTTTSSSSSTSSSGGGTKDYSSYPSGSWEPQEEMNQKHQCSGVVPTYAQAGPLNVVGYQAQAPGQNKVWRSVYSLSDADRNSDAWKSCAWYCEMTYSWNGSRCVSDINIRFSTTQVKIGGTLSATVTTAGYTDSYYTCMETPALPNNCANGANFSQLSKNPDWQLNGTTFTLTNYPITSAFQTGQYTGYVAVAENGVVKDPHRTARRHSFNVVPGDTGTTSTTTPPSIYLYMVGDVLRGSITTTDPSNTWACMDAPGANTCSNRANWTKHPAPGWTQSANGFVLSDLNLAGYPRGKYTGYVSIGNNGNIGTNGSSSFTY